MAAGMLRGQQLRQWAGNAPAIAGRLAAVGLVSLALLLSSGPQRANAEAAVTPADPYGMIVMLQIRMPRGEMTCTGFMVGSHTVATAAHCLFNNDMGGWATGAFVTPGIDGLVAPYATVWSTSFTVSPNWVETQELDGDYGAINLPTDGLGVATGWFELSSPTDYQLSTGTYETAGYGTSIQYGTLWRMAKPQPLADYDADFMAYVWGTTSGESGAPIFASGPDGRYRAVGLLKGSYGRENSRVEFGLRMNDEILGFYRDQIVRPAAPSAAASIPTMFTAEPGSSVRVTSPITRINAESVLQSSTDQVRWSTIATQRTDGRGVASYVINPTETRYYRVVVRGVGPGRVGRGYVAMATASFAGVRGTFSAPPIYSESRVALTVFQGGSAEQLTEALRIAGANAAWVQDVDGVWHVFAPGAGVLNEGFLRTFPNGFDSPMSMTLIAA